jgi:cell division protein FtsB
MKSFVIRSLERENPDKKKRLQLVIAASMFLFQETAEFGRRLFHSFFFRI